MADDDFGGFGGFGDEAAGDADDFGVHPYPSLFSLSLSCGPVPPSTPTHPHPDPDPDPDPHTPSLARSFIDTSRHRTFMQLPQASMMILGRHLRKRRLRYDTALSHEHCG